MKSKEMTSIFSMTLARALKIIKSRANKPEHTDKKAEEAFSITYTKLKNGEELSKSDLYTMQLAIRVVTESLKSTIKTLTDSYNYYCGILKPGVEKATENFDENWENYLNIKI